MYGFLGKIMETNTESTTTSAATSTIDNDNKLTLLYENLLNFNGTEIKEQLYLDSSVNSVKLFKNGIDLTKDTDARDALGEIYDTPDTVAVILPSPSKSGKGLAVDLYRTSVNDTSSVSDREKEVLLPRSTDLLFLGYKRGIGSEDKVAVFQRVDK